MPIRGGLAFVAVATPLLLAITPVAASPQSEELSRQGLRALQAGDMTGAVRTLVDATGADPQDGRAFFYLGVVLNRAGQPYPALTALRRAISLKAIHRDLMFEAGWAALDTGHYAAAAEFLAEHLKRDPNNAKAYEFLGRAHLGLGRPDEAEAELNRALALDPALEPSVRYFLGRAAFLRGERDEAAQALNRIQREDDGPIGRTLLDVRRRTAPREASKPWTVLARGAVGINTNVTGFSDDVVRPASVTGTRSNYLSAELGGQYRFEIDPRRFVVAGGLLGNVDYQDIGGLDTRSATVFATYEQHVGERVRALATVSGSRVNVGGERFVTTATVNPVLQIRVARDLQIEGAYSATRLNYADPTATPQFLDRDATLRIFAARAILSLDVIDSEVTAGVEGLENSATGSDYDYRGRALTLGLQSRLPWQIESNVGWRHVQYDYDNLHSLAPTTPPGPTAFAFAREDTLDVVTLGLSRPITDMLTVFAVYANTRSRSNLNVFSYTQEDAQIGLTFRY